MKGLLKYHCLCLCLVACAVPQDEAQDDGLSDTTQELDSLNGTSLNGTSLNGTSLNGTSLNGTSLNGTSLNGTSLNGTAISAAATTTAPLTGAGLVGSKWTGTSSANTAVALRIDSALQGTGANADLWFYGVSYQTSTGWSPLCGVDANNAPILAVSVIGKWSASSTDSATYVASTTAFTLACRGKTIAKCVEDGYKTFKGYTNQLLSCVRLLRADFCGTGVSYTVDGTLLNLYDNVGIELDTEAWHPEAEWSTLGAVCVNSSSSSRYMLAVNKDPKCIKPKLTATCGTSFGSNSILIDELP